MYIGELSCCGVREFHGLNNGRSAEDCLAFIGHEMDQNGLACAFMVLTEVTNWRNDEDHDYDGEERGSDGVGSEVMALIRENKLGVTTTLAAKVNPNSGNTIQPYLWNIDFDALRKWARTKDLFKQRQKSQVGWRMHRI